MTTKKAKKILDRFEEIKGKEFDGIIELIKQFHEIFGINIEKANREELKISADDKTLTVCLDTGQEDEIYFDVDYSLRFKQNKDTFLYIYKINNIKMCEPQPPLITKK